MVVVSVDAVVDCPCFRALAEEVPPAQLTLIL
jgi:hypothetical protein